MSFLEPLLDGYKRVAIAGVLVASQSVLNFVSGVTVVNNPTTGMTDVTVIGGTSSVTGTGWWHSTSGSLDPAAVHGAAGQIPMTNVAGTDVVFHAPNGDVSLSASVLGDFTVTGLQGNSLPALTAGALVWTGSAWSLDATTITAWGKDLGIGSTATAQYVSGISGGSGTAGTVTLGDGTHNLVLQQVASLQNTPPNLTIITSAGFGSNPPGTFNLDVGAYTGNQIGIVNIGTTNATQIFIGNATKTASAGITLTTATAGTFYFYRGATKIINLNGDTNDFINFGGTSVTGAFIQLPDTGGVTQFADSTGTVNIGTVSATGIVLGGVASSNNSKVHAKIFLDNNAFHLSVSAVLSVSDGLTSDIISQKGGDRSGGGTSGAGGPLNLKGGAGGIGTTGSNGGNGGAIAVDGGAAGTASGGGSAGAQGTASLGTASAGTTIGQASFTTTINGNVAFGTAWSLAGDVTGTIAATVVGKIQGNTVTSGGLTKGQFMVASSTSNWAATTLSGDLTESAATAGLVTVTSLTGSGSSVSVVANTGLTWAAGTGYFDAHLGTGAWSMPTGNGSWAGASNATLSLTATGASGTVGITATAAVSVTGGTGSIVSSSAGTQTIQGFTSLILGSNNGTSTWTITSTGSIQLDAASAPSTNIFQTAAAASGTPAAGISFAIQSQAGQAGSGSNIQGGNGSTARFQAGGGGASTGSAGNSNGGDVSVISGAAGTGGGGAAGQVGQIHLKPGGVDRWILDFGVTTASTLTITHNVATVYTTSAGTMTANGNTGINLQRGGTTLLDIGVTTTSVLTFNALIQGSQSNSQPYGFQVQTAIGVASGATLTAAQYINPIIILTGTLVSGQTVTLPNKVGAMWYFDLQGVTLGAQTLTFSTGSGTTAAVVAATLVSGQKGVMIGIAASNVVTLYS